MTPVALIRHGPTDWNEARRLQGRADRMLSAAGRATVAGWTLPADLRDYHWLTSPLARARETARLLGLEPAVEPALIEMDWGEWEGATMPELQARFGAEVRRRTAMGLDLRPHGGETPREVRARVAGWIETVGATGRPTGAVCHQGIIRAFLSLATGWEMVGEPPIRFDWAAAHVFTIDADGGVALGRVNISLEPA